MTILTPWRVQRTRRPRRRYLPPRRRWSVTAGTPAAETFPTVLIDVGFGSNPGTPLANVGWTDITQYVHSFSIRRGRSSELDDFQAGTCTLELDNSDRRFDPAFTGTDSYLDLPGADTDYAQAPDVAGFDILGDLDIRAKVALDDYTLAGQNIVANTVTGTFGGYGLRFSAAGAPTLEWGNGTAILNSLSSVPGFVDGSTQTVRATLDVDDGAGNRVITFYTSPDDGQSWVQFDQNVVAGTTTVVASTGQMHVGHRPTGSDFPLDGKVYWVEVRNGIGGTVVASPDFRNQPQGTTTFLDAQGNVWTLNGTATLVYNQSPYEPYVLPMRPMRVRARINSVTYPLFAGFVTGWPQDYTPPNYASCTVQCVDAFEVLRSTALPSSVYAYEVAQDDPQSWWRLGESGGTSAADGGSGDNDGTYSSDASDISGVGLPYDSNGGVRLAGDGTPGGGFGEHMRAPSAARLTSTPFTFECVFDTPSAAAEASLFSIPDAGDGRYFHVVKLALEIRVFTKLSAAAGRRIRAADSFTAAAVHHLAYTDDGATRVLYIDGVNAVDEDSATTTFFVTGADVLVGTGFTEFGENTSWDGLIDEVALYQTALPAARIAAHSSAVSAPWDGNSTGVRVNHLLDVISWPAADRAVDVGETVLGPARLDANDALSAMKAVESTESGRLFVGADGRVVFFSRHWPLRNDAVQATWGESSSELPYFYDGFQYRFDRDQIRNVITGSRAGGSPIAVSDQTSTDTYQDRGHDVGELLVATDNEVRSRLHWTLDHFKDPLLRVEEIIIKPQSQPGSGGTWTTEQLWSKALALDVGQRHTVKRLPQQVGAAISTDVLVEGVSHQVDMRSGGEWVTEMYLSPADTLAYWKLGQSALGTDTRLAH